MKKQKNTKIMPILRRLSGYMRPFRVRITIAVLFEVFATVFAVLSPKILGSITTELTDCVKYGRPVDPKAFFYPIALLIGLYLFSYVCTYVRVHIMVRVTQSIIRTMRTEAAGKLRRLPLSYYDTHAAGDVMSRITNDIDLVSQTLQSVLTEAISAVVILIGVVIMMLTISPLLTLICLLTLPAGAVINTLIVKKSHRFFHDQSVYLGQLNAHIEETFTGHSVIRTLSAEKKRLQEFDGLNRRLYSSATKAQYASGTSYPLTGMVTDISYISICIIGAFSVVRGTMEIGNVLALIQYSTKFSDPIRSLSNLLNTVQSAIAGAERCFEFLDEPEELPDTEKEPFAVTSGAVSFNDVSFSYTPDAPLIEHFDLTVSPGDSVAIVGRTGAGKTTLVNLLMRFYEIQGGSITIDGTDIRDMSREDLRKNCGMVLQDTWLFEGTVRENLLFGCRRDTVPTDDELYEALRIARLENTIRALPSGLDAPVSDNGSNFSSGQRQLLAFARTMVSQPRILILDEATSSVDTRTEQAIQKAMAELMKNRTSFIIAHRLATIRHARTILVMEQGHIGEQGSHEELLARRGAYYDLYHSQFLAASEDPDA